MQQSSYKQNRYFLKDSVRKTIDFSKTDQSLGIPPPPKEKPYRSGRELITLAQPNDFINSYRIDLQSAIRNRESHRKYTVRPMSLRELSFLLWATQGIRRQIDSGHALRIQHHWSIVAGKHNVGDCIRHLRVIAFCM